MDKTRQHALMYKNLELEARISRASPHELIQLLFDEVQLQLRRALDPALADDRGQRDHCLAKCVDIISYLQQSLAEVEKSELPHQLYNLYDYMARRLVHARSQQDDTAVREVQALVETIASGWRDIATQSGS